MKILTISDVEAKKYYDYYTPGMFSEYDLILSCGDLKKEYIEFLTTMSGIPLLYVRGNHDDSFLKNPPEGCICIEDKIYEYKGIRFLGLGGSIRYRPDGKCMYTERQMQLRILKLFFKLIRHRGFDVLVAHSPAYGLGDLDSRTHRGFKSFLWLMNRFSPAYFIHGHVHRCYNYKFSRTTTYGSTTVVNACEYYPLEM